MPPSSGISVRGERVAVLDWGDAGYSDEALQERLDSHLPKLFDKLKADAGNAECSVNLSANRLRGPDPIANLLRKLREANIQVVTLRLHKNQLGDDAMKAVVEHMQQSSKNGRPLLELHLSDNKLTEVSIQILVEAAHQCRFYFSANTTPERRCRALWLRCENQRPPIADPHGLLERLTADGLNVCLLPSKEFQPPPGGKGRAAQMEAPVHMHHAFAPRSLQSLSTDAWPSKEKGTGYGKDGGKGGKERDWWSSEAKGGGKDGGGAQGKSGEKGGEKSGLKGSPSYSSAGKGPSYSPESGSSRGRGYEEAGSPQPGLAKGGAGRGGTSASYSSMAGKGSGGSPDSGQAKNRTFANFEDQKGKGKSIADAWRNPDNYKKTRAEEDWYDDEWDDPATDPSLQGYKGGSGMQWGDRAKGKDGKGSPPQDVATPPPAARSAWVARHPPVPLGSQVHPQSPQPPPSSQQGGLQSYGVNNNFPNQSPGGPPAGWDGPAFAWLKGAAEGVRWKVKACKNHGLLTRSLSPNVGNEADWQAVANLGARSIAQQCTQRASVMVGSFVEEAGVYELSSACAGEAGLGLAFRQMRLAPLFPPGTLADEQNDSQCASLLAAIFGELVDAPLAGESTLKENARKVAEWAVLDFIFLMGTTRLTSNGLMSTAGLARPTRG